MIEKKYCEKRFTCECVYNCGKKKLLCFDRYSGRWMLHLLDKTFHL